MSNYDYEKEPQGAASFFELKIDKRTERFLETIKDLSCPRLLEVGMGQGGFLKKIAELRPDAQLYGIDISNAAIKAVKEENSLKGEFVAGDAQELPFPRDFFDVVVIMDVLEHLENPQKAILEIKRVLKPGGIFHFFVPCEGQPFTLDRFLRETNFLGLGDFTKIHFGHIQYFSHADIEKLAGPHFPGAAITYSGHWISQILHFLTLYLPKKLISLLGKDIQTKTRDAYRPESGESLAVSSLVILKNFWLLVTFPVSVIYKTEA
ncbi:MAG: class I SAM-dependent methyltransferase, partial [Candidatus Subteraquimicrobiales bacterium]|nr:class I SAM-dependent methyltransferase [Candidatus Subteraquimicrobiales bacterium]